MSYVEYMNAVRLGKKEYQHAILKEKSPFLPVLDEMIKDVDIVSEVNLGIMTIPLDNIVGTKTAGRTQAFASNFMPLMNEKVNSVSSGAMYMITRWKKELMNLLLYMNT